MNDVMIAYPNTRPDVLGQLRRRGRRGGRERRQAEDALRRAAPPGGQDRRPRSSPPTRGRRPARSCPTSTPSPATRRAAGLRAGRHRARGPRPGRAARLLRHRRARALRQPDALRGGRRRRLLQQRRHLAGRQDPGQRVRRPRVQGPPDRRHRHRQHLGGLPPTCAARPVPARSKAPRSAWPTSSAWAAPAACTSWRSRRPEPRRPPAAACRADTRPAPLSGLIGGSAVGPSRPG